MNLYTNHQCFDCEGRGFLADGNRTWTCPDCDGSGVVSYDYIIYRKELAEKTAIEGDECMKRNKAMSTDTSS